MEPDGEPQHSARAVPAPGASTTVVTLMFTDLVDSCGLHARLGDEAVDDLRREHYGRLSEAVKGAGGRTVKHIGDGMMAVFSSAVDAVACATAIQRSNPPQATAPSGQSLDVRIGLNAGEVTVEEGDYFGTAVNVAARLCQAADGGQILASDLVRGLVGNRGGHRFEHLGPLELKGMPEPLVAWAVNWSDATNTSATARDQPGTTTIAAPFPAVLRHPTATSFVGRAEDLVRLERAWAEVAEGRSRLAFVAGEPGIGKTRLSAEFAERVHGVGALVLYGHADEEAMLPYQPFVEAIDGLLTAVDESWRSELLRVAGPELTRMTPHARTSKMGRDLSGGLDPETERFRLFESVTSAIARAAESAPVLIVLDDLHWADKPTLLLLRHLARSPKLPRVLLLGTYRETDLDRRHPLSEALADLRREPRYERILLRGLSQNEVREYMEAAAQHEFTGRGLEVPDAIYHETEGNPFFVAEIIRHLIETGKFFQRDGVWVYDAGGPGGLGLPEGVRDVIGRRLAQLDDETNQVLTLASVLGREFEFDVLGAMAGPDIDVLAAVEEGVTRGLLIETQRARAAAYAFSHALIRQTLYEELSLPRKQKLHLRAGEAIEQVHARDVTAHVSALALHFGAAGAAADSDKTIGYALRAGRAAFAAAAYEEAVTYLESALQLIDEDRPGSELTGPLLEQLGDLMHVTGIDRQRGIDHLQRALALYSAGGHDDRLVWVQSRLGRAYSTFPPTMNINLAFEHYGEAKRLSRGWPSSVPLGYLNVGIMSAAVWGTRTDEGLAAADEALAIADATGNEALWINAAAVKGWFLADRNQFAEGVQLLEAAWQAADRSGHVVGAFFATLQLTGLHFYSWDVAGGLALAQREIESGRLDQIPDWSEVLRGYSGEQELIVGDAAAARQYLAEHPDLSRNASTLATRALMYEGKWEDAVDQLSARIPSWEARGVALPAYTQCGGLAHYREITGDLDQGLVAIDRACEIAGAEDHALVTAFPRIIQARLHMRQGAFAEALAGVADIRSRLTVSEWGGLECRLQEVEAEIALARGEQDAAEESYRRVMAESVRFPFSWYDAEFQLRWGIRLAAADPVRAARHFDNAVDIYRSNGFAQRWVDRVRAAGG